MRVKFNMSMTNGRANGVEIYSIKLRDEILRIEKDLKKDFWYIKRTKLLALYRIFWNFFILPFKAKKNLVYSFSTHGSPFVKNQIVTIHDLICFAYPKQHLFQYYYFKYLVPMILSSCKKVVVISEFTKRDVLAHYKIEEDKIEVIYNGCNFLEYNECEKDEIEFRKITQGKTFFLTVGASYHHKNIERLLKAIKENEETDALFVIVAKKNKYGSMLVDLSDRLNLKNVVFIHSISQNLLAKLYQKCLCNIYISLYEGFGFPPLEAASLGTVSLVSDIPVMREVLGDSAIFVNPQSEKDIAEKIKEIYENFVSLEEIKKSFPSLLSKFSWNKSASQIIDLIKTEILK
ncbi:glycosyltransferase family 1 protein [Riemerella anatipestifer]|uniref:glycosyltransferase family 4 protein n=1 Tax=Riemerella anatipestifer TaxID=34085 RepID=UPI00129E45F2|nr:glycosyltransferase family 1 protein [Riemerella anatipestifer]MRM83758.1 glycosyltransferase family 1 protein [Riemerella anatipestifer]